MTREKSCCFTGHRSLSEEACRLAVRRLAPLISSLAERGITTFYAGGAIGFDLAASVSVLNAKALHPELTLILALPCRDHMLRWRALDRELFQQVMKRADETVYLSEKYTRGCMQIRNRYMVDRSAFCICWLTESKGGTYQTVRYAEKKGLGILNLARGEEDFAAEPENLL